MARPRLFSFFNPTPDAAALVPSPVIVSGITSEPPLTVSSQIIADPASEILNLTSKLASVTAERDQAQAAYTAGQAQCTELEAAIVTLKATLAGLTTERDTLKAEAARTREDLTQELRNKELATLAASQGIPAGVEIVPANGPGAKSKDEELEQVLTDLKAAATPAQKGALVIKARALRDAIRSKN